MARTTINSQGVPVGTITASDLSYPLTDFSSTGIDDNASSNAITISSSQAVTMSGLTYPTSDGNADQVLKTNGSGTLSFVDVSSGGVEYVAKTTTYTASANEGVIANTSGGAWTLTLPASPSAGDKVFVADGDDWSTNNLTVARNGSTIEGSAADFVMDYGGVNVGFIYDGSTWQVYPQAGLLQLMGIDDNATSTALTIDSSRNVGIGTASPASLLEVEGVDPIITLDDTSAGGYAQVYALNGSLLLRADQGASVNNSIVRFDVDGSERMRIDSSGNLLIGATTNTFSSKASVAGSLTVGEGIASTSIYFDDATASTSRYRLTNSLIVEGDFAIMKYNGSSWDDALYIDENRSIGIGTTNPANNLHIHTDSGDEGILIKSTGDTSNAIISDANRSSAGAAINNIQGKWNGTAVADMLFLTGSDTTNKDDGVIAFRTSSANNIAERMRIDGSGNLLVGKTSIGFSNVGFELRSGGDGRLYITNDNEASTVFRRNSSNGVISYYYQASNQVGLIGSEGSDSLYIGTSDTGLKFSSADIIQPFNPSTVAARDAAIDLGNSGARFKDIYLSGGAYLGGTGAANHLDDYEEGTCTISFSNGGTNGTFSSISNTTGYYTKIGNLVTVSYYSSSFTVNSAGSGGCNIGGLPFIASNSSAEYSVVTVTHSTCFNSQIQNGYVQNNATYWWPVIEGSVQAPNWATGSGKFMMFTATYFTDQ